MKDYKHNPLAQQMTNRFSNGKGGNSSHRNPTADRREKGLVAADGKDVSGWEAYRRWLTRVQAPEKRRAPLDPGLYTWKGYRNWSDKVRREWSPDE